MISEEFVSKVLGRPSHALDNRVDFEILQNERILITGGMGSLGLVLSEIFLHLKIMCLSTDIETLDVTNFDSLSQVLGEFQPTVVVHLAADKHAPQGELDPYATFNINTIGTQNLIRAVDNLPTVSRPKIVLASTCKSCDPETVYGASKLIAERLILNHGDCIARFYNVIETDGNVFQIWDALPASEEILVTPCSRFFISRDEAISLLVRVIALSASNYSKTGGRFTINPGEIRELQLVASLLYPERQIKQILPRRGDRLREPLMSNSESFEVIESNLWQIHSPHDPL